ncbi:MAG: tetratricopeptide repeat protein, partial [Candidatus Lokiarchaeota archaeon]|nr:tetratricopeptide repeat protein [Candidatus Lokiarchaeota archaeon]
IEVAEKCVDWILGSQKELGNTFEIVWANLIKAIIMMSAKSRFDLAMEYTKKAMSIAKEIKFNHFWIALCQIFLGVIHVSIGEFNISLKHYMKSLAIFKEIGNNFYAAGLLGNIGNIYVDLGNYDIALKYLEESLLLYEIQSTGVANALDNLIMAALEKGDIERAQKYFQRLESIYNQKKKGIIVLVFQRCKALILLKSSRIRDKAKAEKLLKKVVETETIHFDIIIDAIVRLCDLLLSEFRINNNSEVLDEVNHYIAKLLIIAEKSHSFLVFCETFILQAKLALLNFNVKAARRFLTQAQKIADSYGIKRLAMKISYDHDELLKQSKMWENLQESEISISERWKLAGLSEQMEKLVRKRKIEVPELSDEEPVLLLIVSEGGVPFFSKSFIEEKSFESHLFGGFLTTIDYFIKEMFSEGLDRAIFGEHTLLMKSVPPFFITYVFKGDSYFALKKLDHFQAHIQKEEEIWQKLLNSLQVNKTIQLNEIPLLDSLITKTFLTKSHIVS